MICRVYLGPEELVVRESPRSASIYTTACHGVFPKIPLAVASPEGVASMQAYGWRLRVSQGLGL